MALLLLVAVATSAQSRVHYSPATDSPVHVFFATPFGPRETGESKQDILRHYFATYPTYGITDFDRQLVLISSKPDVQLEGWYVDTYQQVFNGIPVYGVVLKVSYDQQSRIVSVNGVTIPKLEINTKPSISREEAERVAESSLFATTNVEAKVSTESELVIHRRGLADDAKGTTHLAYRVALADAQGSRHQLLVDAVSGDVVESHLFLFNALRREVWHGTTLYWNETLYVNSSTGLSYVPPDPAVPGARDTGFALKAAKAVYELFFNLLQLDSYDGNGGLFKAVALPQGCTQGASWASPVVQYCPDQSTIAPDLIAHEWAHAYTAQMDKLVYYSQAGALHESFADITAASLKILRPIDFELDGLDMSVRTTDACLSGLNSRRWVLGETLDNGLFTGSMDMWKPTCIGTPDIVAGKKTYDLYPNNTAYTLCAADDNGMIHANAAIPDHAFALLVDGNGSFPGIGLSRALNIYLRAKLTCQTPWTTFAMHAYCLKLACTNLANAAQVLRDVNGQSGIQISTSDCTSLDLAIAAVGMENKNICGVDRFPNGLAVTALHPTVFSMDGGIMDIHIEGPQTPFVYIKVGAFYQAQTLNAASVPGQIVQVVIPHRDTIGDFGDTLPVQVSLDGTKWVSVYQHTTEPLEISFYASPVITAVFPTEGSVAGGYNVTIYGEQFADYINCVNPTTGLFVPIHDCLVVKFNGLSVPVYYINDQQIIVTAPTVSTAQRVFITISLDAQVFYTSAPGFYYIHVAALDSLSVYGCGQLTPVFSPDIIDYQCDVTNVMGTALYGQGLYTDVVNVTANYTVHDFGSATVFGEQNLDTGVNLLEIVVVSVDGEKTTVYQVLLNRQKSVVQRLSTLGINDTTCINTLTPAFDPHIYDYTCNVSYPVVAIALNPTPLYREAAIDISSSSNFVLGPNTVLIQVTPEIDQDNTVPLVPPGSYKIVVRRLPNNDPRLRDLHIYSDIDQCVFSPPFDPSVYNYSCVAHPKIKFLYFLAVALYPGTATPNPIGASTDSYGQPGWPLTAGWGATTVQIQSLVTVNGAVTNSAIYSITVRPPNAGNWSACDLFGIDCWVHEAIIGGVSVTYTKFTSEHFDIPTRISTLNGYPVDPAYWNNFTVDWNVKWVACAMSVYSYPGSGNNGIANSLFMTDDSATAYLAATVPTGNCGTSTFVTIFAKRNPRSYDASLAMLSAQTLVANSPCILNPPFSPTIFQYNCTVEHNVASLVLYATPNDTRATISGYDRPINPLDPIQIPVPALLLGNYTTVTLVGASFIEEINGTNYYNVTNEYTYVVSILRHFDDHAVLDSLDIPGCTLRPPFAPTLKTGYVCEVPYEYSTLPGFTAVAGAGGSVLTNYLTPNGMLQVGDISVFSVVALSQDQTENATYEVKVIRRDKPYNTLKNLTAKILDTVEMEPCILVPDFDPNITSYYCIVDEHVKNVEITAVVADPDATVATSGGTDLLLGSNLALAVVTAADKISIRNYVLNVIRASDDANLYGLTIGNCQYAPQPFYPGTTLYYCPGVYNTSRRLGSISVLTGFGATYVVSQNQNMTNMRSGLNLVSITVTAQNLKSKKVYQVVVFKDLVDVSACSPNPCVHGTCNDWVFSYTCTCNGIWYGTNCDKVPSRRLLSVETETVPQPFTRKLLGATSTQLASISASACTISPAFLPFLTNVALACDVDSAIDSLTLIVTKQSASATVAVTATYPGAAALQFTNTTFTLPNLPIAASVDVKITVSDGGSSSDYLIVVSRQQSGNNFASYIAVSNCQLSPAFNPSTTSYDCTVPANVSSVNVTYATQDPYADSYTQGGSNLQYDVANPAIVVVTAQNHQTRTYSINIYRVLSGNYAIQSLDVPDCITGLSPSWTPAVLSYQCTIPFGITDLGFTVKTVSSFAQVLTFGSNRNLLFGTNDLTMRIVAQNGAYQTLSFFVIRNADPSLRNISTLNFLSLSGCTFTQQVRTYNYVYNCSSPFPNNRTTLAINDFSVTLTDPQASVSVSPLALVPFQNEISVTVTAANGVSQTIYYIGASRDASSNTDLASLAVNVTCDEGPVVFTSGITTYPCTVSYTISAVQVVAVLADADATFVTPTSRFKTFNRSIPLGVGPNTIQFTVQASNLFSQQPYTITIIRKDPSPIATLAALSIKNCSFVFSTTATKYFCVVASSVTNVSWTATPTNAFATVSMAVITKESNDALQLYFGYNLVKFTILAQDGITTQSYSVIITRLTDAVVGKTTNLEVDAIDLYFPGSAVNALDAQKVKTFGDSVVKAIESLDGIPPHRVGLVGLRPTSASTVHCILGVVPWTGASDVSSVARTTISNKILAEYKNYQTGQKSGFSTSSTLKTVLTTGPAVPASAPILALDLLSVAKPSQLLGQTPLGLQNDATPKPGIDQNTVGGIVGGVVGGLLLCCVVGILLYCKCCRGDDVVTKPKQLAEPDEAGGGGHRGTDTNTSGDVPMVPL